MKATEADRVEAVRYCRDVAAWWHCQSTGWRPFHRPNRPNVACSAESYALSAAAWREARGRASAHRAAFSRADAWTAAADLLESGWSPEEVTP